MSGVRQGLSKLYRQFAFNFNTLTDLNASVNPGSENDYSFAVNLDPLSSTVLIGQLIYGQWWTRPAFRMNEWQDTVFGI